jgi:hypothetical protein
MSKKSMAWLFLALIVMAVPSVLAQAAKKEILGISVGMSHADALARLEQIGRCEKDERKQQEVWALTNDPRFSHLIVAFTKGYTEVRYVTAKARAGAHVRYQDMLDLTQAKQVGAQNNNKYVLEVPASGGAPSYVVIARGTDPNFLTYFSLEKGN